MPSKGQLFTLDLFVSLVLVLLVMSMTSVLIDRYVSQMYSHVKYEKIKSIADDVAAYKYYTGNLPTLQGYIIGDSGAPSDKDCVYSTRGTSDNPVSVYVCK